MRAEDVERYRGRWIAIRQSDEVVVADAASLEELQAVLRAKEHAPVLIHRVPRLDEPIYIGLG
jgi:hypothetical protein